MVNSGKYTRDASFKKPEFPRIPKHIAPKFPQVERAQAHCTLHPFPFPSGTSPTAHAASGNEVPTELEKPSRIPG